MNRIWKSKCSPSIKIFMWKMCIGKLPVRAGLGSWSSSPSDCTCCPGVLESMDHALFDCPCAARVWDLAKWSSQLWPSAVGNFMEQIAHRPIQGVFDAWLLISSSVLWAIWKARNDRIFGDVSKPPYITAHLAIAQAEELFFLDRAQLCRRVATRSILDLPQTITSWAAPPQGALKVNLDGAWCAKGGLGQEPPWRGYCCRCCSFLCLLAFGS